MYVRNLTGEEFPLQATTTNEMELNGNQSVSATIYPTKVNKAFINDITEMWIIGDHDGVEHKIIYAKKKGEGNSLTVEVKAIPLFFDTFDTLRIYEEYNEHMTALLAFTRIFADTPFNFVLVDQFDAVQWEGFGGGETRLETFKRALERYEAEFRIVGNIVYLHKLIGRDTQFQYRYRLNASNIEQENDASAMWTYAKGYGDYGDGDGGEDWKDAKLIREYTSPLAAILGVRHAPPIQNGNIKVASFMDEQLKTLVDESLKISVSATIHDLRKQGYPLAQPELGDRVFLIDERIGLDDEVRVVHQTITRNWKGEVLDLSLTFGSEGIVKRHQSELSTAIKNITELLKGRIKLPYSVYDDAIKNAVQAIKNAQTELIFPEGGGIWGVDPTNPNYVTGFTSRGFMVSVDGGATAKAAITGEGVVAETIIGQSIIGVNLASVDEKGYFRVSGNDAEFFDLTSGRRVSISPSGIYGYNASNSVRFRADSLLVTSAALGTSNSNVYLAADATNEVRVVDINEIPSDGVAENYRYRPLRALGYRFGPGANGYIGTDGEVRITSLGFRHEDGTIVYRNLRTNGLYANYLEGHGESGVNVYVRPQNDGELRVTFAGTTDSYADVRAATFYGSSVSLRPSAAGIHFYVRPAHDGEVRMVGRADLGLYRPVRASNYLLPSGAEKFIGTASLMSLKPQENEASEMIKEIEVMRYTDDGMPAYRVSSEQSPVVATEDEEALDIEKTLNLLVKSQQETVSRLEALEGAS